MKAESRKVIDRIWRAIADRAEACNPKVKEAWLQATDMEALQFGSVSKQLMGRFMAVKWYLEAMQMTAGMQWFNVTESMPVEHIIEHRRGAVIARACALYMLRRQARVQVESDDIAEFARIDSEEV